MNDISFASPTPDKEQECLESNFCNIQCIERDHHKSAYDFILGAYLDQLVNEEHEDPFLRRPGSAAK